MTNLDFRPAIRRALQRPCTFDLLSHYRLEPSKGKCTRTAFRRLMLILDHARAGRLGNANDLAREFHVTTKTIYRDVEFLRREFGLPIVFNRLSRDYVLAAMDAAESLQRDLPGMFTQGKDER